MIVHAGASQTLGALNPLKLVKTQSTWPDPRDSHLVGLRFESVLI